MSNGSSPPLRIAILGGGLAGGALFRSLLKHPHLQVDIFESAPVFREKGQAIGFYDNGVQALERLGLKQCIHDAAAVRNNTVQARIGWGPDTREVIGDLGQRNRGTWIAHRAAFLDQIFRGADQTRMHTAKKLERLEDKGDEGEGITLFFADGSTFVCDVLFGADGIHSRTRRHVLGEDDPALEPVFADWWNVWMLRPVEEAMRELGTDLINPEYPLETTWTGPGGFVMHNLTNDNTLAQTIIGVHDPDDGQGRPWQTTTTREKLLNHLDGWDPKVKNGIVNLVSSTGDPIIYSSLWDHKPARTIVKGAVGLVGDAAGATTPWQGSGGGMAMEDVYLLFELFGRVKTVREAKAALLGYDQVQRPRRQKLTASSRECGLVMGGCHPDIGMDTGKIRQRLLPMWDFLVDVDLQERSAETLAAMREFLK